MNTITTVSILRLTQVLAITGFKKSTIYNFLNPKSPYFDSHFPRPRKIGKRSVGWVSSEIFEWVATRATA